MNDSISMAVDEDLDFPGSGVSMEATHPSAGQQGAVNPSPPDCLTCGICGKTLGTKHTLRKHLMCHKIEGDLHGPLIF